MHFKIIVCCYNVEKWISANIKSIKEQTHKDFQCIIVDDMSTDKTVEIASSLIVGDDRFKIIRNTQRNYASWNIYHATKNCNPSDDDIVTTVDGDDWLASPKSLEIIEECYKKNKDILMTYGSYITYPEGKRSTFGNFPSHIIENNDYRKYPWIYSHMRTQKYKIFKHLEESDLISSWDGKPYNMAYDMVLYTKLLELSNGRIKFMDDELLVYNKANTLNENKVSLRDIRRVENEIRSKEKNEPIF